MKLQDIPIEQRYYGNAEKTQGREVREGKFDGATHFWCMCGVAGKWLEATESSRGFPNNCQRFWSRPIDVGEGWRLLKLEESVEIGDEHFFGVSCGWIRADAPRGSVLHEIGDGSLAFAYRRRIESKPGEWVSVKDRLPKEFSSVWIFDPREGRPRVVEECSPSTWSEITHWQPAIIPAPPPPEKSEAEIAWEQCIEKDVLHENSFIAGFAAGKGAK